MSKTLLLKGKEGIVYEGRGAGGKNRAYEGRENKKGVFWGRRRGNIFF